MFELTSHLPEEIKIDGKEYRLNLFFDTVLLFFDLMNDDDFDDFSKIEIAFDMFVEHNEEFDFEVKFETVKAISEQFVNSEDGEQTGSGKIHYDLKQDAEYIYSSFLQEYNIDLIEKQGELHWYKFRALLNGLRDDTRFKEIVGIRAAELPTGKGMEEERKRLTKLKNLYALKKDQRTREEELDELFNVLAGK